MMVPEIALTPSVVALFRSAFGARVAIQHSGLSDGERHDQWQRIRRAKSRSSIGTRSAVFAPLSTPGSIIVDEEHDTLVQTGRVAPLSRTRRGDRARARRRVRWSCWVRRHPRWRRIRMPSTGKYTRLALERRVLERPLASVTLVNMRDEYVDGRTRRRRQPRCWFPPSRIGWRGASRCSSCSIGAAMPRPCSAASAATRSNVRTAACR